MVANIEIETETDEVSHRFRFQPHPVPISSNRTYDHDRPIPYALLDGIIAQQRGTHQLQPRFHHSFQTRVRPGFGREGFPFPHDLVVLERVRVLVPVVGDFGFGPPECGFGGEMGLIELGREVRGLVSLMMSLVQLRNPRQRGFHHIKNQLQSESSHHPPTRSEM